MNSECGNGKNLAFVLFEITPFLIAPIYKRISTCKLSDKETFCNLRLTCRAIANATYNYEVSQHLKMKRPLGTLRSLVESDFEPFEDFTPSIDFIDYCWMFNQKICPSEEIYTSIYLEG